VAVLETEADDQADDLAGALAFAPESGEAWWPESVGQGAAVSSSLPAAYGIQPLAPVRPRGR
ncbi:MAG TPA: hypothetical protein VGF36_05220, partial [Rhodopila sp.]